MNFTKKLSLRRIGGSPRRARALPDGCDGGVLAADGCGLLPIDLPRLIQNADTVIIHGRAAVQAVGRGLSGVTAWVGNTAEPVFSRLPTRLLPFAGTGRGNPSGPPSPPTDPPNTVRVSVLFAVATYALLECIASRNATSMPQALRDSIVLRAYIERAIDGGARILIDRGNGTLTELVLA